MMILLSKLFDPEKTETMLRILQNEFPLAIWETLYVTVIATLFSVIIGLPLGVLIVAGARMVYSDFLNQFLRYLIL